MTTNKDDRKLLLFFDSKVSQYSETLERAPTNEKKNSLLPVWRNKILNYVQNVCVSSLSQNKSQRERCELVSLIHLRLMIAEKLV